MGLLYGRSNLRRVPDLVQILLSSSARPKFARLRLVNLGVRAGLTDHPLSG